MDKRKENTTFTYALLATVLAACGPGDSVDVTVADGGEVRDFTVELSERS